jgi:hypothetical protein
MRGSDKKGNSQIGAAIPTMLHRLLPVVMSMIVGMCFFGQGVQAEEEEEVRENQ